MFQFTFNETTYRLFFTKPLLPKQTLFWQQRLLSKKEPIDCLVESELNHFFFCKKNFKKATFILGSVKRYTLRPVRNTKISKLTNCHVTKNVNWRNYDWSRSRNKMARLGIAPIAVKEQGMLSTNKKFLAAKYSRVHLWSLMTLEAILAAEKMEMASCWRSFFAKPKNVCVVANRALSPTYMLCT